MLTFFSKQLHYQLKEKQIKFHSFHHLLHCYVRVLFVKGVYHEKICTFSIV